MRRPRLFGSMIMSAVVLLGVACVPTTPPPPSTLTITTTELPVAFYGQPYSFQLQTTGSAGPVTWTVLSGALPAGLSLDSAGSISSTFATGPSGPGGLVRVQATDGSASTTKLLLLVSLSPGPAPTGGPPLPEGDRIVGGTQPFVCASGPCPIVMFVYDADGTTTPWTTMSVQKAAEFGLQFPPVTADGSRVVSGQQHEGGGWPDGPVEVLDGDSGAVLVTLEPDPAFQMGPTSFSPDGSKVALSDQTGHVRVFDATNGAVLTSFQTTGGPVVWSHDSNEIVDPAYLPSAFTIRSASGPGTRQVTNPGGACSGVGGWSATNRLLIGCGNVIKTMSAVDGSDVRDIATGQTGTFPVVMYFVGGFSPSGTRILLTELTITSAGPPVTYGGTRLLVASDVTASPFTELVSSSEATVYTLPWT